RNAVWNMPTDFPSFPAREDGDPSIVVERNGSFDWIMAFVYNTADLAATAPQAMATLAKGGLVWFCFPKKTSKIKTDLSRDQGWEVIFDIGIKYVNLVSVNATWSAFGGTHGQTQQAEKGRQKSNARLELLAQYMDHSTREMRYPDDLVAALAAAPAEKAFFDSLSFTNRKEYLEWIVTAKRQETRDQRVRQTIASLREGRKNPAGR
ncbi:MAG TPA: YdeI/OmpD-associated family protein, partial [Bacteroidia bacterium]|nr:YdeI/OmpD-associated family protein [Bacteroidia bacterium]